MGRLGTGRQGRDRPQEPFPGIYACIVFLVFSLMGYYVGCNTSTLYFNGAESQHTVIMYLNTLHVLELIV